MRPIVFLLSLLSFLIYLVVALDGVQTSDTSAFSNALLFATVEKQTIPALFFLGILEGFGIYQIDRNIKRALFPITSPLVLFTIMSLSWKLSHQEIGRLLAIAAIGGVMISSWLSYRLGREIYNTTNHATR